MTCKDCYHYKACLDMSDTDWEHTCNHFKDKSRIVELPCKVGQTVYEIRVQEGKIIERVVMDMSMMEDSIFV